MIRSYPPFSAHASEFFKFHFAHQKPLPGANEETQSVSSSADDESVTSISECCEENRSRTIEITEVSKIVLISREK